MSVAALLKKHLKSIDILCEYVNVQKSNEEYRRAKVRTNIGSCQVITDDIDLFFDPPSFKPSLIERYCLNNLLVHLIEHIGQFTHCPNVNVMNQIFSIQRQPLFELSRRCSHFLAPFWTRNGHEMGKKTQSRQ